MESRISAVATAEVAISLAVIASAAISAAPTVPSAISLAPTAPAAISAAKIVSKAISPVRIVLSRRSVVSIQPVQVMVLFDKTRVPVEVVVPSISKLLSPASLSPPMCKPPLTLSFDNGAVVPMPTRPVLPTSNPV